MKTFLKIVVIFNCLTQVTLAQVTEIPYSKNPVINYDGLIDDDEYPGYLFDNVTNISLYMTHNGTHLFTALQGIGTGWMSIGLGPPGIGMDGANIILGYILDDTNLVLIDEIGIGRQHFSDKSRGGKDDILMAAGLESNGETVIEFSIPLDSGDKLDHQLIPGNNYGFFLAYHESEKNAESFHTEFSETFELRLSPVPDEPAAERKLNLQLIYLGVGLLLLLIMGYVYIYATRPKVFRFSEMKKES
jgi:hypothetical protein